MNITTKDLITREYVRIAPNRSKVMLCLGDGGAMTPKDFSLVISSPYRTLNELLSKGLIYQVNSSAKRDKLYALTPRGQFIYEIFDMNIPSRMLTD